MSEKPTIDDVWKYYDERYELDETEFPDREDVAEQLSGYEVGDIVPVDDVTLVDDRLDECVELFYDPKGETPNISLGYAWDAVVWEDGEVVEANGFFDGVEAAAEHALVLAQERGFPVVRTTNITNTPTFDDD